MVLALIKCNNQPACIRKIIQVMNNVEGKMKFLYIFSVSFCIEILIKFDAAYPTTFLQFSGFCFYFLMSYGCRKETLKHISDR